MRPESSVLALCVASLLLVCLNQEHLVSAGLASFVLGAHGPKLFQRAQHQPAGVQQDQLHQQQLYQQQLQPLASHQLQAQPVGAPEPLGIAAHFGAAPQADLMRVGQSQMFAQQQQQHHLHDEPDFALVGSHEPAGFEAQAAGFYRPTIEPPLQQAGRYVPAQSIAAAAARARGIRLEPSQTEIVDKIERHIGHQIEQSLAADSQPGYGKQHEAREKEASASSSQPEESEELEEPAAEKRLEQHQAGAEAEEKKPAHEEEHHHHHQHEHSPVEAFEVHHKKGGKSFQYFHQGHSS